MIKQLFLLFTVVPILNVMVAGQIYGNHDAKLGQFPFHVSVQQVIHFGESLHVCSGTIVAPHWVLTSATCYHPKEYLEYRVIAGTMECHNPLNFERQEVEVKRIVIHPKYKGPPTYVNDIAVVELDYDLTFNEFVNKAKIASTWSNKHPTVTGWSFKDGTFGNELQFVYTDLISEQECNKTYPSHFPIIQKCYGPLYEVCLGYTSDPLVIQGTLIGITAYSSTGTCITGYPYVYTPVYMYLDFIDKYIKA